MVQSPSGCGKTTLLRELYAHIHRLGGASQLNFDFHPDYTDDSRIACGFIPQHAPLVKHWRCDLLLPKSPGFFGVFFPEFSDQELTELPSKRVGQLSGGQVRRLLACSALEELCSDDLHESGPRHGPDVGCTAVLGAWGHAQMAGRAEPGVPGGILNMLWWAETEEIREEGKGDAAGNQGLL